MDTWSLTLVCGYQERVSVYTAQNVQHDRVQMPGQGDLSRDPLYRLEVRCAHDNCGTLTEVHIYIEGDASPKIRENECRSFQTSPSK